MSNDRYQLVFAEIDRLTQQHNIGMQLIWAQSNMQLSMVDADLRRGKIDQTQANELRYGVVSDAIAYAELKSAEYMKQLDDLHQQLKSAI